MKATVNERTRASYIRRRLRAGKKPRADLVKWLEEYDAARSSGRGAAAAAADANAHEGVRPGPGAGASVSAASDVGAWGDVDFGFPRVVDFGSPDPGPTPRTESGEPHDTSACPIKDCPKCKSVRGAMVCATTGERVWPRMTEHGAEGMAGGVLGMLVVLARVFLGRDVTILESETKALAKPLREIVFYYGGPVGAAGDFFALAGVLLGFGMRVAAAPRLRASNAAPATKDGAT